MLPGGSDDVLVLLDGGLSTALEEQGVDLAGALWTARLLGESPELLARVHRAGPLKVWFTGFAEGWRTDPGARRPMSWGTVWRLTRTGRPPVV